MTSSSFSPHGDPWAGSLVMVNIDGTSLSVRQAEFLRRHHIRAVCLFRANLGTEAEVRRLTADLREVMGPHALIGLDQEGGSVVRATFLPQAPAAMALGAADDERLCEDVGAAVARGVRSLGINWDFAPVLDVNNNPANPVIAERSFSADAQQAARLAGAWMRGALREGVACCVKHFPGHGDTHVDSHLDLPVVDKPYAALEALELLPFRILKDEAPAMMTAHIVYPQLDREHPATLSRVILGDLLRRRWGYDGVVITDSLVMKAIHERYGHHRAAVMALDAGADMVMALGSFEEQEAAVLAIEDALADGRLDRGLCARAVQRLDQLAERYPAGATDYPGARRLDDDALMRGAWARGLTLCGGARPPALGSRVRVVAQRRVPCDGVSEAGLDGERVVELLAQHYDVEALLVKDLGQLRWSELPYDGRYTVLASNHRARYPEAVRGSWRPDLHLVLWNPFQVLDVAAPAVVTWGYADGALDALSQWLAGRVDAPGRLPVDLVPPTFPH
ncbi:beta-N-acetylhexosaminidase [Caldimonas brevitalea]|uniref:Beta-N-acetylhexosaminidase n=1 Tax=Caldimonas brevitalea TaxID=413882 RepID=A0A0G3BQB9_9BURK|nr:beta-N-acetylhexosaminidase [Caldimonas brevitalea]AKJ31617.1 beta-N-acetylhexosaminidase [Caldimonas brevitalea]